MVSRNLFRLGVGCAVLALTLYWLLPGASAQNVVTVVSAASSGKTLAPGAIASAYGTGMATDVKIADTQPLPTSLLGTTVRVNGQLAALFYVAPAQINFVVPDGAQPGTATIEVQSGTGAVSRGQFEIKRAAPAIFTANSNGSGPPAAYYSRYRGSQFIGNEPVAQKDQATNTMVPAPVNLNADTEQVFLICFLSGVRKAGGGSGDVSNFVRVVIGGLERKPDYAAAQGDFAGLDQLNLSMPRELIGRGRVSLVVSAEGAASNEVELEIAPPAPTAPPTISGFGATATLAGERLTIAGSGFAVNPGDNVVRIGDVDANVVSATATQLTVEVPFGVRAGRVSVKTPGGENFSLNELGVRTSISGFVTDTADPPNPLRGATISVETGSGKKSITTSDKGSFVLPDMAAGLAKVTIDGTTVAAALPYPAIPAKLNVVERQDNRFTSPLQLQQIVGPGTGQPGSNLTPLDGESNKAAPRRYAAQQPIKLELKDDKQVVLAILEIPGGATIAFPPGAPNRINLTLVNQSRVPAQLPRGLFSQRIVQITPFGATISPGAKLTFQNLDNLPANAQVKLFRFDKEPVLNQAGTEAFVEAGTATVSASGERIETAADAVKDAGFYFVAAPQLITTAAGRVLDGAQPVRQAIVAVHGQNDFTDGNGGFQPRDVSVKQDESLSAEVSYQRPSGGVIYTLKTQKANAGGVTNFGNVPVNAINPNQPPHLEAPDQLTLAPDQVRDVAFVAFDPEDRDQITIQLELVPQSLPNANPNARFVAILTRPLPPNFQGVLRFSPTVADIGEYALKITLQDNAGENKLSISKAIAVSISGRPGTFALSSSIGCGSEAPSGPVVHLTWTRADRADSYDVSRDGLLIKQGLTVPGYDDKDGLTAGGSYNYQVTARNPAGAQLSPPINVGILDNVCASFPVTVMLDQMTGAPGASGLIPVRIGDLTGRGVIAFEFELVFDPAVLQFQGPQGLDQTGTLSGSMTALANTVDGSGGLRVLRVGAFTTGPLSGPNRVLLRLRFNVVGQRGASTALIWQRFLLNESSPPVTTAPGRFTVN